jgi:hypothetical protein
MSELTNELDPAGHPATTYFRTTSGTRVHLPACPHLVGTDAHAATAAERLLHPVCDWSQAQLRGYGREHFASLEDAMRRVGVPVEAHATIGAALRFVEYDKVFAVHSLTYGALGFRGRAVAGFGKTYYWVGARRVNLPAYVESARAGRTGAIAYGELCLAHHVLKGLNGACDYC